MTPTKNPAEPIDPLMVLDMAAIQSIRAMEVEGQPSILEEVVSLYLELAPKLLDEARSGLAASDCHGVLSAAHQLKSMSGQLGTWQVAETASQVEELGRRGELEGVPALLDRLDEAMKISCLALHALR